MIVANCKILTFCVEEDLAWGGLALVGLNFCMVRSGIFAGSRSGVLELGIRSSSGGRSGSGDLLGAVLAQVGIWWKLC